MPYIKRSKREEITNNTDITPELYIQSNRIDTAGDLNYAFTILAQDYLKRKNLTYQHINDIIGALEGAKLEMYRRIASPYEDKKIEDNGDVDMIKETTEDTV